MVSVYYYRSCLQETYSAYVSAWSYLVACKCSRHVPLDRSLTTLAAAYPAGFCRAVMILVVEFGPTTQGPWLGDTGEVGNVVATDTEAKDMLVWTGQSGTIGKHRRAAVSTLYAIIVSECLPWRANLKMALNKKGPSTSRNNMHFEPRVGGHRGHPGLWWARILK